MAALSFTTVRIADVAVEAHGHRFVHPEQILRDSDGAYRHLGAALSDPLPDLAAAVALAESLAAPLDPKARVTFTWRADLLPRPQAEHPCPICGAPAPDTPRFRNRVCNACTYEATSADGRLVRFDNINLSGGFEGQYVDDKTTYDSRDCYIRGVPCRASQARLGGIVIQPV